MAKDDADWLFDCFNQQLDIEWSVYRGLYSNTKGTNYEKSFRDFLNSYFEGVFSTHAKVAPIDKDLRSLDLFDFRYDEDEFDIVGLFEQASPKVIFETGGELGDMRWVPYDGVSFVCEIKSELNKRDLKSDLLKLLKLSQLDTHEHRFIGCFEHGLEVLEPIRCLVYDGASIDSQEMEDILFNS